MAEGTNHMEELILAETNPELSLRVLESTET
jgi:hypothetical protein